MTGTQDSPRFRLAYVPGVTPAKWVHTWGERLPDVPLDLVAVTAAEAATALMDGEADAGLVRLPVDRDKLSAIPLYAETTVVVVPKDHELTAVEEVALEELDPYIVQHPLDDCLEWDKLPGLPAISRPETTADAIELVAAGVGLLLVPQSLARLHHRKDLVFRPVNDVPQSQVVLSWLEGQTTDLVEEFIGIVRGRTVNSTRGRGAPEPAAKAAKSAAKSKAAPKPKTPPRAPARSAKSQKPAKPRRRK